MRFLMRVLVNAAALWAASQLVPGIAHEGGWMTLLLVALVFGVVNAVIRPILALLTCPLQILTLGLFTLVLNAILLWITGGLAQGLGLGFRVDGFWPAFVGGLVISVVSILLSAFVRDDREHER